MSRYPVWIDNAFPVLLREVAPGLFVGSALARPAMPWRLVVDLARAPGAPAVRPGVPELVRPCGEADAFPDGLLDELLAAVGPLDAEAPVLVHCEKGWSRSPAAAYALLRRLEGLDHETAFRRVLPGRRLMDAGFPRPEAVASARAWAEAGPPPAAAVPDAAPCCELAPGAEVVVRCCGCAVEGRPRRRVVSVAAPVDGADAVVTLDAPVELSVCSGDVRTSRHQARQYVHVPGCPELDGDVGAPTPAGLMQELLAAEAAG